jgi:RHS repeat-associated protein
VDPSGSGVGAAISLPKGGGAIKGIGETFQPNLFTGTGNFSVPIPTSPGRQGFGPSLALQYSTGNGNGPFGLGWQLSIPRITRKTEKGLPLYTDDDVFILSGAEDLVVSATQRSANQQPEEFDVVRYRPRTEGLFARIERWTHSLDGDVHWRATTRDNVTSIYGKTAAARIFDPEHPDHVFEWLLEETFDAKGDHILYEYAAEAVSRRIDVQDEYAEDATQIFNGPPPVYEVNRSYASQRYVRRILYGNVTDEPVHDEGPPAEGRPQRWGTDHLSHVEQRQRSYVFEVVFDYGLPSSDLDTEPVATPPEYLPRTDGGEWEYLDAGCELRPDPFSTYRSGFEIRTLRRCHRVLMVHHFSNEIGVKQPGTVVKATELRYQDEGLSLLSSVTVRGYRQDESEVWHSARMPPLEFKYTAFEPGKQRYRSIEAKGDDLPPFSLRHPDYAMVDLQGDALPDVIETGATRFRYWRNLGDGLLDRPHPNYSQPAGVRLSQPGVAFGDTGGDGLADLIVESPLPGFYETTPNGEWRAFRKFDDDHYPSFSLSDPNVRLLDLTGDGRSDALVTTDHCFHWFECLGESGYAYRGSIPREHDPDRFPDVYFNDPSGRVRLASLSGSGLMDICLVHDGRIDYWPNLGRGRFGKRITMANTPRFGYGFDPKRLFLVDLDGDGCADLAYVDFDRVRLYFSRAGNSWSDERVIEGTPFMTDVAALQFADVFGTGTATLLWSYDYGTVGGSNYKALDFCGGVKPYLLSEVDNNLGATTRIAYAPSTKFYLEDLARDEPWVTALPFPVHVVEKVEVLDHIGRAKLVTTYRYHHGYYDGHDREFRGFGRVDQFDTESFDDFEKPGLHEEAVFDNKSRAFHVPPTETRTWFHTGVWFDEERSADDARPFDYRELTNRYRREFYSADSEAWDLPQHELVGVTGFPREVYRALRGAVLRTEVYGRDGSEKARHPYLVTDNRYRVEELQAPVGERHRVYLSALAESLVYHYERNPADPRIGHTLNLEWDSFGNVLKQVAIAYGRRRPDQKLPTDDDRAKQAQSLITYTENCFTNEIDAKNAYRTPLPCETTTCELNGYPPSGEGGRFESVDFTHRYDSERSYEHLQPTQARRERRLIERVRTLYRKDDLTGLLPLRDLHPLALPGETYKLAFTKGLLDSVYKRQANGQEAESLLPNLLDVLPREGGPGAPGSAVSDRGGYVDLDGDGHWWAPSGRQFLAAGIGDDAAAELGWAKEHFYLPHRWQDPFGHCTTLKYDRYDLLPTETEDALGNCVTVGERGAVPISGNDYRVLQPKLVTDPNGNRTEVAFDALGMVVGTAVMGKRPPAIAEGDTLDGFGADVAHQQLELFMAAPRQPSPSNPRESEANQVVHDLLDHATTRIVYDLDRFRRLGEPAFAATIARETHVSDLKQEKKSKLQISFSYSDGFGREIQRKAQAEPGPLGVNDPASPRANPRWVGSGWTVFNNKGKPVRQYEPFFTPTHSFEFFTPTQGFKFDARIGVSRILFYDSLERVVAILHPNHTWEKVVFDPWRQETWDVNDTLHKTFGVTVAEFTGGVLPWFDSADDKHVGWCFKRLTDDGARDEYWPTWFQLRTDPDLARAQWPDEKRREAERIAARNALAHAATPTETHLDSLGRTFLTRADNGLDENGQRQWLETRLRLDIQGNDRVITDPMGIDAFKHDVDMLGRKLAVFSVDAGHRRTLPAVDGQPVWSRDANGNVVRIAYDELRRPAATWVDRCAPYNDTVLATLAIYGERLTPQGMAPGGAADPAIRDNHRGRIYAMLDGAGASFNRAYDFKGNVIASERRLAKDTLADEPDWRAVRNVVASAHEMSAIETALQANLETTVFRATTAFDALNRVTQSTAPDHTPANLNQAVPADGTIYRYRYNEAGLLQAIQLDLKPGRAARNSQVQEFVTAIDYNARGQRTCLVYGNGVTTEYDYDPETFRLTRMGTRRADGSRLAELYYCYDPAGNLSQVEDAVFHDVFNHNQRISAVSGYLYDPVYRLVQASGREHEALNACNYREGPQQLFIQLTQPLSNGQALRNYKEHYRYDRSGNLLWIRHEAGPNGSWRRSQAYETEDACARDENGERIRSNRLHTTSAVCPFETDARVVHDANGNITRMPGLPDLGWNHADRLVRAGLDSGLNQARYTYDAGGQRVRKVVEQSGERRERVYLGNYEIYWKWTNGRLELARHTLHIIDGQRRVALVESDASGVRIRYQLANHLESSVLEFDDSEAAALVTYEEYTPYGGTAYMAGNDIAASERRRYRYSGKERDEETGLYYYGARYYAPWVGRWLACDLAGRLDGLNMFRAFRNNPARFRDSRGAQATEGRCDACVCSLPGGYRSEPEQVQVQQLLVRSAEGGYVPEPSFEVSAEDERLSAWASLRAQWHEGSTADRVVLAATFVGVASSAAPVGGDFVSLGASSVSFIAKPSWTSAGDVVLDVPGLLPGLPPFGTIRRAERINRILDIRYFERLTKEYRELRKQLPEDVLKEVDEMFKRPAWNESVKSALNAKKGEHIHHGVEWQHGKQIFLEHLLAGSEFVSLMRRNPAEAKAALRRMYNDIEGMKLQNMEAEIHRAIHKNPQPMAPLHTPPPPDIDQAAKSGAWEGRLQ